MEKSKKTRKRRKSRRKRQDEHCSYVIEAQHWNLNYSISLNDMPKLLSGTFLESLNLEVKGIIREPRKYADKPIDLKLLGDRTIISRITEREEPETKPNGLGSITLRGEQRECFGILPLDVLPIIKSLLDTKEIQFARFYGFLPKYGFAHINSIYFLKTYSPDEQ